MKNFYLFVILLFSVEPILAQGDDYHQFFTDNCLRIDYELVGNRDSETAVLKGLQEQGAWAGQQRISAKEAELGNYRISVVDSATGKLLYSNGFSSLSTSGSRHPRPLQPQLRSTTSALCRTPKTQLSSVLSAPITTSQAIL